MFMNSVNQPEGNQDLMPCFGTINWDDFEDKCQFPQITDLKTPMNTSKDIEEWNLIQSDTSASPSSVPLSKQVPAVHPQTALPYAQCFNSSTTNGGGTLQITDVLNQVPYVHPPTAIPYTLGLNSSMSSENGTFQSTALPNQVPNVDSPTAMSYEQCISSSMSNNSVDLHSTILKNQVSNEHPSSTVPYTKDCDSSMSNEHWAQILSSVQDPKADISPFREYVNQGDGGQNTIPWTQQDTEDLLSFIADDLKGTSSSTNCQVDHQVEVNSSAKSQFQLSGQKTIEETDFQRQKNDNKLPEIQSSSGFISQEVFSKTGNKTSFEASKLEKIYSIDKIPEVNYCVSVKESKSFLNESGTSQATDILKGMSAYNTSYNQVTGTNTKGIKTSISGPSRTRVGLLGRCRQGEVPLYLQSEPENTKDKIIWRRAIISHQHRVKKNNELANNANTIEYLKQEMAELKNKLSVVAAERDTLKTALDTVKNTFGTLM